MQIEKQQDKSLLFLINYCKIIKLKHKVELILMDGRQKRQRICKLYSLHNQIMKWKEFILDYHN
ncbi:unnamed protein product [Paramecium octaurelia]|uniref:Uncharacterized protein n=1 Tax=Paramecium octaurelia TaxID=43137 RepID=A0A8S1TP39_PAROT|nr:unnamed protein product [Paramecium octaurelia]